MRNQDQAQLGLTRIINNDYKSQSLGAQYDLGDQHDNEQGV